MAGIEKLYLAIVNKLRADTGAGSLVTLTTHDITVANGYKIGRWAPIVKKRSPYLGVRVRQSVPLMGMDVTQLQITTIDFYSSAISELTSLQINDRLESLLHAGVSSPNTDYYDFSDANVSTRSSRFKSRRQSEFDEDIDVWTDIIRADIIWIGQPCP